MPSLGASACSCGPCAAHLPGSRPVCCPPSRQQARVLPTFLAAELRKGPWQQVCCWSAMGFHAELGTLSRSIGRVRLDFAMLP